MGRHAENATPCPVMAGRLSHSEKMAILLHTTHRIRGDGWSDSLLRPLLLRRLNTLKPSFWRRPESRKTLDAGSSPAWRIWPI